MFQNFKIKDLGLRRLPPSCFNTITDLDILKIEYESTLETLRTNHWVHGFAALQAMGTYRWTGRMRKKDTVHMMPISWATSWKCIHQINLNEGNDLSQTDDTSPKFHKFQARRQPAHVDSTATPHCGVTVAGSNSIKCSGCDQVHSPCYIVQLKFS